MNPNDFESDEEEPVEKRLNFSHKEAKEHSDSVDESHYGSAKRPKIETLEDRFSSLSDCVLLHILSFLPTIEEVIRTSALSKRWQYCWTSIPTLTFTNEDQRPLPDFISFVGKTLIQCRQSKLKKFKVHFDYKECFASQVNMWIGFALSCNVEVLDLNLQEDEADCNFKVPEHLFTNSILTKLGLRFCIVKPGGSISWKILRKLSVDGVKLQEDVIQNILSGSPFLEILKLGNCYGFNRLDITSESVRKLILDGYIEPGKEEDDAVLEVFAPNILSLDIVGDLSLRKLLLVNLPSLVEANLDFQRYDPTDDGYYFIREVDQDMLKGLLQSIRYVNELSIGGWCIQVISALELKGWRSPSSKRKYLKTTNFFKRSGFPGLVNLLQSSPYLKTLLINNPPHGTMFPRGSHTRGNYLTWQKWTFQCLQLHLKTVKIAYLLEWDRECELVQFLLQSACVLEKMIIYVEPGKQSGSESSTLLQLTLKLLSCPRASKDALILFPGLN